MSRVTVGDSFILLLAILILTDHGGALPCFLAAAALHECGHFLALLLCGGKVTRLHLTAAGAVMRYRMADETGKKCLVTVAGPLCSLLGWCVGVWAESYLFAGANLLLGACNLLPIQPLDGGVLLQSTIGERSVRGSMLCRRISCIGIVCILSLGTIAAITGNGWGIVLLSGSLVVAQRNTLQKG